MLLNEKFKDTTSFKSYLLDENPGFEFFEYEEFFPHFIGFSKVSRYRSLIEIRQKKVNKKNKN